MREPVRRATRPCQSTSPKVMTIEAAIATSPAASALSACGAARRRTAFQPIIPAEAVIRSAWPSATRSSAELCPKEWSSSGGLAA